MTATADPLAQLPALAARTHRLVTVLRNLINTRPGDDPAIVATTNALAAHNHALQALTTVAGGTR